MRAITDLGAEVEDGDFNRADVLFHCSNPFFDAAFIYSIQQVPRCRPAFGLDLAHQAAQACFIAASTQHAVVAFSCETFAHSATDAGACAED